MDSGLGSKSKLEDLDLRSNLEPWEGAEAVPDLSLDYYLLEHVGKSEAS